MRARFALIGVMVCLWALVFTQVALAQEGTSGQGRDNAFEAELLQRLGQINPQAVPVFQEATRNSDAGNLQAAKQGFEEVLRLAPDFPDALRRLSGVETSLGNLDQGLAYAQKAYEIDPSPYNQSVLASALLAYDLPAKDFEALEHAKAAAEEIPDDFFTISLLAWAAAKTNNQDILRTTSNHLIELAPNEPYSHYMAGGSATMDKKWERAEAEFLLSKKLGAPSDQIDEILKSGISRMAAVYRWARRSVYILIGWLVALLLLFLTGSLLSRLMISAIRRPASASLEPGKAQFQVKPDERLLRRVYQVIIAISSIYYYVSIPILIVVAIALTLGGYYLLLSIEYFPYLGAVIGMLGLYSLIAILRGIFKRPRRVDPGRLLLREEAPGLWALSDEVARKLETRRVEAIYITPAAEIAVTERGRILKKLRGKSQRCLILGLGVLSGMTQGQFQSILAHEYGHFSNRDTAGGNLAYQVQASIRSMAQGLVATNQDVGYNPVWLFINGFHRIYLRITLGASRLQEVLADRYAVIAYGSQDFVEGLTHVVRQSLYFEMQASLEIQKAVDTHMQLDNLYALPAVEADEAKQQFEEKLKQTLERKTSSYDSHPSYQERIELVRQIHGAAGSYGSTQPVWDLIPHADLLQREMTDIIQKRIAQG
jgi:Zn-dependent protease with chaperone function/Flp pilus assembly protein TadD